MHTSVIIGSAQANLQLHDGTSRGRQPLALLIYSASNVGTSVATLIGVADGNVAHVEVGRVATRRGISNALSLLHGSEPCMPDDDYGHWHGWLMGSFNQHLCLCVCVYT